MIPYDPTLSFLICQAYEKIKIIYHLKTNDAMCICVLLVLQESKPRGYSGLEFWHGGEKKGKSRDK